MFAPKVNLVAGLFTRKLVGRTALGKFRRHDKYRISLNMYMKYKGLESAYSEVLEETWNGLSMNLPPVKGGRETPSETAMGLAYRRGFNIDNGSLYNQNAANGQQPYEQEEEPEIGKVQAEIDSLRKRLADLERIKRSITKSNESSV